MDYKINFIFTAFIVLLLFSCKKTNNTDPCPENKLSREYTLNEDKTFVPYNGNDTIILVHTTGTPVDTSFFIGQGIKYYFTDEQDVDDECGMFTRYHGDVINYKSINLLDSFQFNLYENSRDKNGYIDIYYQKQRFFEATIGLIPPYYLDTLTIQGKKYSNISIISNSQYPPTTTYYCYYNKQFGILRFKFKDGEMYDVLKK